MASKRQQKSHKGTVHQHYVPQLYLRGFTNSDDRLFCYDKLTGRSYSVPTKSAAQESRFYEILSTPELHVPFNAVERGLAVMEGMWAPVLVEFINSARAGEFDLQQVMDFAPFVVIQWMRTTTFRETAHQLLEKWGQQCADDLLRLNYPDSAGSVKVSLDKKSMAAIHAEKLFDLDEIERMSNNLIRLIWVVGVNETENPFYTSDHPVVRRGNWFMNGHETLGTKAPGIEFVFPLTSKYVLLLLDPIYFSGWRRSHLRTRSLTSNQVQSYNELQVRRSNQRIYCVADDFDLARETCAAHPEICDPNRPRIEVQTTPIVDLKNQVWIRALE